MITITCCICGVEFGLSEKQYNARATDGKLFHCPNGHHQHFGESTISKLEKQLNKLEAQLKEKIITLGWYTDNYTPRLEEKIRTLKKERKAAKCRAAGYKSQYLRLKKQMEG